MQFLPCFSLVSLAYPTNILLIHILGQTRYPSKSWIFKSLFLFKVKQHSLQQLNHQYKTCWVVYKMVGAFSPPSLFLQPPLQSPTTIPSSTSATFNFYFTSLLVDKTIPTILNNSHFFYTSVIFHHIFTKSTPATSFKNYFPYLDHSANSNCILVSKCVLFGVTLFWSLPASLKHVQG